MDAIVDQFDAAISTDEDDGPPPTLDIEIDVTFQKRRFDVLHLCEPKAKHVERAERELVKDAGPHHFRMYQMRMIALVAEVPIEVVGELPHSVVMKAWDFLFGKLQRDSPPTGGTSSET